MMASLRGLDVDVEEEAATENRWIDERIYGGVGKVGGCTSSSLGAVRGWWVEGEKEKRVRLSFAELTFEPSVLVGGLQSFRTLFLA